MTRRQFLQALLVGGSAAAAARVVWGVRYERWSLHVTQREMPVKGLPLALGGLRVAVLSDFHAGTCTPWWLVRKAVDLANRHAPDITFLVGDFVSLPGAAGEQPLAQAVSRLSARYGVWAVTGNHEYFFERKEPVIRGLKAAGVQVLLNDCRPLRVGDVTVWIAGLEDPVTEHHDFEKTMAHVPLGEPILLLAHTPDIIYAAAELSIGAVFAGHTHGGQVRIPLVGPPIVPSKFGRRFASGLFHVRETSMFVTRGVGMVPPLVRLFCPPEVAILTLVPT